jgi:hypothetical protein
VNLDTIIIDVQLEAELGDGNRTYLAGGFLAAPHLSGIAEVLIPILWSDYGIPDLIAALGGAYGGEEKAR